MANRRSESADDAPVVGTAPKVIEVQARAAALITPRKPVPQELKISARQYCRARGHRWERCAGFLHDMNKHYPGDRTRPEWDQLWAAFWARPV